jgi:hypothetical protein
MAPRATCTNAGEQADPRRWSLDDRNRWRDLRYLSRTPHASGARAGRRPKALRRGSCDPADEDDGSGARSRLPHRR